MRDKKERNPAIVFLLASLATHLAIWLGAQLYEPDLRSVPTHETVEFELVDNHDNKTDQDLKQIVEQDKSVNEEVDEKTKYLGQFDQKVLKETRAARHGDFKNQAGDSTLTQPAPQKKRASKRGFSLADLRPGFTPEAPSAEKLNEDTEQAAGGTESSATNDYLREVELGMETMLSTREFVYYSYYQRIKERLRQHWEPSIRARMRQYFRQGRQIASTHDHVTRVLIVLNRDGELIRVELVTPSGLQILDDAATDAFRSAQPFPNPPKGMADSDGNIRIRWDFVLEARTLKINHSIRKTAKGDPRENGDPSRL